jgi:CRISPR-associated protein Csm3
MATKKIFGKVVMEATLVCGTGLHIGANKDSMEIGAVDSPVVRDPVSRYPLIPGSSLKGKLRSLADWKEPSIRFDRPGGSGIYRHECDSREDALKCPVCRVFGSTKGKGERASNHPARLAVRDAFVTPDWQKRLKEIETGLEYTEVKWENGLDRVTAAANPRQLERVPAGTEFDVELIYTVEDSGTAKKDLENLRACVDLLQDDTLGGHGTRGYGKVTFDRWSFRWRPISYYEGLAETQREMDSWDDLLKENFAQGG